MPSSASLKYLVQDLIDGRLSPDEVARVEQLIREDRDLGQTARFYRWLNEQLPKLFEPSDAPLPPRLQQLLDELADADEAADGPSAPTDPVLSSKG